LTGKLTALLGSIVNFVSLTSFVVNITDIAAKCSSGALADAIMLYLLSAVFFFIISAAIAAFLTGVGGGLYWALL
jgi:hypothetical protein